MSPMAPTERAALHGCVGCVYMVEDLERPGVYKVGQTVHLRMRVVMLARERPVRLVWYILTNDPRSLELHFHDEWHARRVEGEWYRLAAKQVDRFRSVRVVNFKGYDQVCPSWWDYPLRRGKQRGAPLLVPVEIGRPLHHPNPKEPKK